MFDLKFEGKISFQSFFFWFDMSLTPTIHINGQILEKLWCRWKGGDVSKWKMDLSDPRLAQPTTNLASKTSFHGPRMSVVNDILSDKLEISEGRSLTHLDLFKNSLSY